MCTPTGDRFLDSVLDRVDRAGPDPAYRWLQTLGPAAAEAVRRIESAVGAFESWYTCQAIATRNTPSPSSEPT